MKIVFLGLILLSNIATHYTELSMTPENYSNLVSSNIKASFFEEMLKVKFTIIPTIELFFVFILHQSHVEWGKTDLKSNIQKEEGSEPVVTVTYRIR